MGSLEWAARLLQGSAGLVKHSCHFVRLKSGSPRSSGEVGRGGTRGLAVVVVAWWGSTLGDGWVFRDVKSVLAGWR